MIIGIICNLNLARSPLITSFLRKNFLGHYFFSAGISQTNSYDYPSSVVQISRSWGLPLDETPNTDLAQASYSVQSADLLICVDSMVFNYCTNLYPEKEIINISSFAQEYKIEISDPINLGHSDFQIVISLYFFLVNEYLTLRFGNRNVLTHKVPKDMQELEKTLFAATEEAEKLSNPLILNYNLRVPDLKLFSTSNFMISEIQGLESEKFESSSSKIYTFANEFVNPEKLYLDKLWRQNIIELANLYDLILIMPPELINGRPFADRYLAALTK